MARVDVGPRAELGTQTIRDRVLDLQADEPRMVVLALPERRLDHERRLGGQMLLPGHARRRLVESFGAFRLELTQGIEHAHGDAGPEADAQRLVQVRGEAHPAAVLADLDGAELGELRGEEILGAARGGREQGKPAGHCVA